MQFKFLSILALAATCVVADEAVEKRGDLEDEINSIANEVKNNINGLMTAIGDVPPNVASVLATALPTPTDANIQGFINSIVSDVNDGTPPAWYTGLPEDAKSFINSKGSQLATALPSATASETGNHAPAARPTGAMMGSLVGAAGVLGLAVML